MEPQNVFYPSDKKSDIFNRGWELVQWIAFSSQILNSVFMTDSIQ